MKRYLRILFLVIGMMCSIILMVQSQQLSPNTYRMNQNVHHIPKEDVEQQALLEKYLSMGYGGFTVNVSFNDYLTPSGMNTLKAFCEKAKANNMELWLYDEQGYPSGSAGGRVFLQNQEWEVMGIYNIDTIVTAGPMQFQMPPGKTIGAFAVSASDTVDLMPYLQQNTLSWKAPSGTWKISVFSKNALYDSFQVSQNPNSPAEKLSSHYPSLMNPEVTEAFINTTHQKYVDCLGTDLGKYFVSTFTDEPSLVAVSYYDQRWSVIPWSDILSETIYQKYGYRPEDKLLALFEDECTTGQQVRYQYFHTVGELISVNYFRKLKDWCTEHRIKSGGHLLLEETMMAHVPLYGDAFACFREMDAPGIDALSCMPENTPVHAPKLASSAAELTGASRIMCEPCPVADQNQLGGKEPPTEKVRGFFNIQLATGVTDFNNYLNLSNANIHEKNKFNAYVARIAEALRGGHSVADIALFYPIESLWVDYIPEPIKVSGWNAVGGGNPKAVEIEASFRNAARLLYLDRWEYNIVDTKAIEDSKVENGQLVHGDLRWRLIILPNVSTLSIAAFEKLHKFVKSGGALIAVGQTPVNSTVNFPDKKITSLTEKLFKLKNAIRINDLSEIGANSLLNRFLTQDILVNNEELPVRFTHRIIDDRHVYFVYNDSDKAMETKVSLRDISNAQLMDPQNGITSDNKDDLLLQLGPYQSLIIKSFEKQLINKK